MSISHSAVARDGWVMGRAAAPHAGAHEACRQALEAIIGFVRHEPRDAMPALIAWWRLPGAVDSAMRGVLLEQLRQLVRRGEATPRAFLPAALGDPDAALVVAAASAYLGAGPVSVEWRAQAVADALDWIRRGLALNSGAIFAALLRLQDEAVHPGLAGLRGRLTDAERATVWSCCAADPCPATQQFLADWRDAAAG